MQIIFIFKKSNPEEYLKQCIPQDNGIDFEVNKNPLNTVVLVISGM